MCNNDHLANCFSKHNTFTSALELISGAWTVHEERGQGRGVYKYNPPSFSIPPLPFHTHTHTMTLFEPRVYVYFTALATLAFNVRLQRLERVTVGWWWKVAEGWGGMCGSANKINQAHHHGRRRERTAAHWLFGGLFTNSSLEPFQI